MQDHSEARYLAAKRSVDDRAINKDVLARLREALAARGEQRVRVFEVGAGLGTMVERLLEWGVLTNAEYTLLDRDAELLALARQRLAAFGARRGHTVEQKPAGLRLSGAGLELELSFVSAELSALLASDAGPRGLDLVIANAFLDIVDLESTLDGLFARLVPGGLYWFCVNFDGETSFLPEHPHDAELLHVYHRSMDERVRDGRPSGSSKTGRRLFTELARAGATVLAAGASDWVVFPVNGVYPAEERHFLAHLVQTVEHELVRHADVDRGKLDGWVRARRAELERGELHLIVHQLDFCGRSPS